MSHDHNVIEALVLCQIKHQFLRRASRQEFFADLDLVIRPQSIGGNLCSIVSANKGTRQYHIDAADNSSNTPGPLPHLFFSVVRERPVVVRISGRSPLDGDAMPQNIDE